MNLLIDKLPDNLEVGGIEYKINHGFKEMLLFEELLSDSSLDTSMKIVTAVTLVFGEEFEGDYFEAMEKIQWFWAIGKLKDDSNQQSTGPSSPKSFDFKHDAQYIYSAFKTQYNIDLYDENIHWWKFISLFKGLTDEHEFSKIIGYRTKKITGDMHKDEKRFYREMKKIHALPDDRTREEKEADVYNAFSNMM